MEDNERRKLSQQLHKESQVQYDRQQNALCFVVIGSILVCIGIVFIFLAMKRENNVMVGIDYTSLAFYIMAFSLAVGVILLSYGIIKFLISSKKRRAVLKKINSLN